MDMGRLLSQVRTPKKSGRLVVSPSYQKGQFDSQAVDCPFLFSHEGHFYMTFVGWDGIGYRTGLAWSDDLENWHKGGRMRGRRVSPSSALILDRGRPGSVTEYNAAMTSILRDNELYGPATLKTVDGRFVGTYHAYPRPGYESGPAVIGLCFSDDLRTWEVTDPILEPDPGCSWEAGGLYKAWLMEQGGWVHPNGTYCVFYNAKNRADWPWVEQTGMATSTDLVHWARHPDNPVLCVGAPGQFDDLFASDPCVLRHE